VSHWMPARIRVPLDAVRDPSTRLWPHFPLDALGPTQDGPTSVDVASPAQDVALSFDGGSYLCFKLRKPLLTWGLSTRKVTMISGKPIPQRLAHQSWQTKPSALGKGHLSYSFPISF
jgi:hypothetical protein